MNKHIYRKVSVEVRDTKYNPTERTEHILHNLEVEYKGERPSIVEIK